MSLLPGELTSIGKTPGRLFEEEDEDKVFVINGVLLLIFLSSASETLTGLIFCLIVVI
jgi:hypothetical protein